MKKSFLFISSLLALAIAGCSTNSNENNQSSSNEGSTNNNNGTVTNGNIIHGHGAPNNSLGSLYSLYVDDDTGKIYEKNKAYSGSTSALIKLAAGDDGAKWIDTHSIAGENFDKESPIADALRSTLLATNVTLKTTDHVLMDMGDMHQEINTIAYFAFNFGSVMYKTDAPNHEGFDDAVIRGYSVYDVDEDSYQIFLNDGNEEVYNFVDHTAYLTDDDPSHYGLAIRFTKRCFNEYIDGSCNFPIFDSILKELDNFTVNNQVYTLDKAIVGSSDIYNEIYGEGDITFSNIEFKFNSASNSIDYLSFSFAFQTNNNSVSIAEDLRLEASNLRTTSFVIPE